MPQLVGEHRGEVVARVDHERARVAATDAAACGARQNAARWSLRASSSVRARSSVDAGAGRARPRGSAPSAVSTPAAFARVSATSPAGSECRTSVAPTGTRTAVRRRRGRRCGCRIGASRSMPAARPRRESARARPRSSRAPVGSCRAITAQALPIGEPVDGRREHRARAAPRGRRASMRPSSRYSVCVSRDIRLRYGPRIAAAVGADRAHHLQLLVDHHRRARRAPSTSSRNASSASSGRPSLGVAERAADRVHRARRPSIERDVPLGRRADRGESRCATRERPVRAALVLEQRRAASRARRPPARRPSTR